MIGTSRLMLSQQFTRFWPTVGVGASCLLSFYFLSRSLTYLPLRVAHALWSGLGIILTLGIGIFVFRQIPTCPP